MHGHMGSISSNTLFPSIQHPDVHRHTAGAPQRATETALVASHPGHEAPPRQPPLWAPVSLRSEAWYPRTLAFRVS